MSEPARLLLRQHDGRLASRALLYLTLLLLEGCFGPGAMHYDIQQYNKQVLSSEKEMLLYNIAALNDGQPPHFMMVSNIAQTRTYSAGASFAFTNLWNKLFTPLSTTSTAIKGGNTYAGGITASLIENPTISFLPIQGQDFATRFESPLTDKLTLFLEDEFLITPSKHKEDTYLTNPSIRNNDKYEWLLLLFAQGSQIIRGDGDCPEGFQEKDASYSAFSRCVTHVANTFKDISQIDTNYPVSTATPQVPPTATEILQGVQANLRWVKVGNDYQLAYPAKIPGFFDYSPDFKDPKGPNENLKKELTPAWWQERPGLDWKYFNSKNNPLPTNYKWYEWRDDPNSTNKKYVLLPDKYVLRCRTHGPNCHIYPVDKPIDEATMASQHTAALTTFSYGKEIVKYLWPTQYDEVYVELRRDRFTDKEAQRECFSSADDSSADEPPAEASRDVLPSAATVIKQAPQHDNSVDSQLVCGFYKIGNLIQILQSLGKSACTKVQGSATGKCPAESVFGIGSEVPLWATDWAPYSNFVVPVRPLPEQWIWVPAHNPNDTTYVSHDQTLRYSTLARRDAFMFFTLYKTYQMSLVNTSQLVTGQIPITISK